MFLGYGQRSLRESAEWLERSANIAVVPLELRDPHLYHLDMALSVLPDGTALVCEAALSNDAMGALERAPGVRQVITVTREDALAFGLNLVAIGDTILSGSYVPRIKAIVESRGYRIRVSPLDQFHLAGGSAACLVAKLHPDPQAKQTSTPYQRTRGSMDMYGVLFRSVMLPLWEDRVRHRPVVERWQNLKRTQWRPLEELEAMQAKSLQRLVRHAYNNVPFYRDRFVASGIVPRDIRTAKDLLEVPIVRRYDLQTAEGRESTVRPFPSIRKQTSGTTGEPLLFGYERDSEAWRRAVKLRAYEWAGYRPGDRAFYYSGAPFPKEPPWWQRAKVAVDQRMNRAVHFQCAVMSDERLREAVRQIERFQPNVLVCYAQAGAELARYINRNGLRTWQGMSVICCAERVLPRDRADLVDAFGPSIFDTYGCREVMHIAGECEAHQGLHVSMEHLVVEIIVTENGRQRLAREGESGEVVFTDLHNFAMPFIRYATGDIATAGPSRRCSCGRTLPRIQSIQGRTSETLRDANGAAVSGVAISVLFHEMSGLVRQFQAVQHFDRSVTISLVLAEPLPQSTLDEIRKNAERILAGIPVGVKVVPHLPRGAAGKHKLVVVEREAPARVSA
jgi:phenylacetate-CoA ligase